MSEEEQFRETLEYTAQEEVAGLIPSRFLLWEMPKLHSNARKVRFSCGTVLLPNHCRLKVSHPCSEESELVPVMWGRNSAVEPDHFNLVGHYAHMQHSFVCKNCFDSSEWGEVKAQVNSGLMHLEIGIEEESSGGA